jgi:mono/diheme cytochrome c family protein
MRARKATLAREDTDDLAEQTAALPRPRKSAHREQDNGEEEPAARAKLRRSTPREDDESDEEEAAPPKRRKPRKKPKKRPSRLPLILGLVLGGAGLLVGTVVVLVLVFRTGQKKVAPVVAVNTPAPAKAAAPAVENKTEPPAQEQHARIPTPERTLPPASQASPRNDPDESAAGRQVFVRFNCGRCHAVAAGGRGRGPNLSRVGANPMHTVEWLMDHVRSPQSHNPDSNMPAFAGKIGEKDLRALADFLASLK